MLFAQLCIKKVYHSYILAGIQRNRIEFMLLYLTITTLVVFHRNKQVFFFKKTGCKEKICPRVDNQISL